MISAKRQPKFTEQKSVEPMEITQDAFHAGKFHALQPKTRGNRSGMDALLLAAALPENSTGILADLGAGAGVAGFAAISRINALRLHAVERNPQMSDLARKSCTLAENAHMYKRVDVIEADVTLSGLDRHKAGLETDSVDHVIMNPPYNGKGTRAPNDEMRVEAFMMAEGGLDAWFRTAAAIMRPGGNLAMIYRTEDLGQIIACSQGRFGNLEIIPIHSREGDAAKRVIVRGIRGSRAPMTILPGFIVHDVDDKFTPQAEAIFKGAEGAKL